MDSSQPYTHLRLIRSQGEAGNVRTFVFETGGLTWIAGQSQGYVIPSVGETEDENQRWFTIASAPYEGEIHISTRVSQSKFKQALNAMQPGETISCYGLEGDFTWEETSEPVVLVAGGIGITPFRSILLERSRAGKPLNANLLYYNRDEQIPFRAELESLASRHSEFRLQFVVGEMIDADSILRRAPDSSSRLLYISGPEPMVENVGEKLRERGVEIKQDWFPGYDEKTM
jgi:ferredoxin-NADP reductase